MKRSSIVRLLALLLGTTGAPLCHAQFDGAEPAIKYRQGAFHMVSIHMQRINGMLRGDAPFDRVRLERSAGLVKDLMALPWEAFAPGSEGGNATDEVWLDEAKFQEMADKSQSRIRAFAEQAKTAAPASLQESYKSMRATCQECHRIFRDARVTRGN